MSIKVLDLKPWEVMKRWEEDRVKLAFREKNKRSWTLYPVADGLEPSWSWNLFDFSVVDESEPVTDWDKFNFEFFNQYGGIKVLSGGQITDGSAAQAHGFKLSASPRYPWFGKSRPVPGNVEVTVLSRCGQKHTGRADGTQWCYVSESRSNIIAFRITGLVL